MNNDYFKKYHTLMDTLSKQNKQMIKLQVDFEDLKKENEKLRQQSASIGQLIDKKIDEFKNGVYGDLPCSTIHMFLDLKQEIGDLE